MLRNWARNSLGCVLYERCALRPPFRGEDFQELSRRVRAGYYPNIPRVYSNEMMGMIRSLLSVKPSQRPTAKSFLDDYAFLQSRPIHSLRLYVFLVCMFFLSRLYVFLVKSIVTEARAALAHAQQQQNVYGKGPSGGAQMPSRQQQLEPIARAPRNLPNIDKSAQYDPNRVVTDPSTPLRKAQRHLQPAKMLRENQIAARENNMAPPAQHQILQYVFLPSSAFT